MFSKMKIECLGLTCLLVLALSGCVNTADMYRGNYAAHEQIVAIQDPVPHKDSVENFDIIINYTSVRDGDGLEISGQAALTERYSLLYGSLNYLYVYLFFLDDSSRVLETVSLATSMTTSLDERLKFSQSLNVPVGAVAITFGYNGSVKEGGDLSSSSYTFYQLPLK